MRSKLGFLISMLCAVGGCGSGSNEDSGKEKNVNTFVGVWSATSGTTTTTCPGQGPSVDQVTDPETWAAGSTSDLVQTLLGSSCVFHANITATTATGVAGQSCTITTTESGDSVTEVINFSSYTFSLSADHATANENFSGTVVITNNTAGNTVNCAFTQTASYSKQ